MLTGNCQFPVGNQLMVVYLNPSLHHFQLLWRIDADATDQARLKVKEIPLGACRFEYF